MSFHITPGDLFSRLSITLLSIIDHLFRILLLQSEAPFHMIIRAKTKFFNIYMESTSVLLPTVSALAASASCYSVTKSA